MKQTTRKLLSLLMAFAIVLSLAPTAWAADNYNVSVIGVSSDNNQVAPGETITLQTSVAAPDGVKYSTQWVGTNVTLPDYSAEANSITFKAPTSGNFSVTATVTDSNGKSGSRQVNFTVVTKPTATRVRITPTASVELTLGTNVTTAQLAATVEGQTDVSQNVTWSVTSGSDVVSVSANGLVTALKAGSAVVTATAEAKDSSGNTVSADKTIKVNPAIIHATGISMDPSNRKSVRVGETGVVFKAILDPKDSTDSIIWSSSNTSVATINSSTGVITARAEGKTYITATVSNSVTTSAELTVEPAAPAISISTVGGSSSVALNGTLGINATVTNAPAGSTISWDVNSVSSSNGFGTMTGIQNPYTFTAERAGRVNIIARLYNGRTLLAESEPLTLTITNAAEELTLDRTTLSLANTTTSTTYGTIAAYLRNVAAADLSQYTVRWSTNRATVAYFRPDLTTTSSSTITTAFTSSSSLGINSPVTIYAGTAGTATITGQLYRNNTPVTGEYVTCTVTVGTSGFTLVPSPSNSSSISINNNWSSSVSGYYRDFSVDPRLNGYSIQSSLSTRDYDVYYTWTLNGYTVQTNSGTYNSNTYRLYSTNDYLNRYLSASSYYNQLTCTVEVYPHNANVNVTNRLYRDSVTWNVYTGYTSDFTVGVTVYDSNPGYDLMDTPDAGGTTSIADQIDSWVRNRYYNGVSSSYYRYYEVHVDGGTGYENGSTGNRGTLTSSSSTTWYSYSDLDRIVFTPVSTVSTSTGSYTISYPFQVRLYNSSTSTYYDTVSGTMTFTVRQGTTSGGDIYYSGAPGADVAFRVSDFENFWNNLYSSGSLSYVTFGSHSSGSVRNSSGSAVSTGTNGTACYVNPSRSQTSLDGVYFDPSSSRATTVRIPFTAVGTTSRSSSSTTSRSGTVVITYLSAAAKAITYNTTTSGAATLKAQDFIDAYKSAVNTSSTPSNLTIEFQNVPSYGTMTYTGGSRDVRLTSSNVKNYRFTTRSSGSNQISDVTYSAGSSRAETVSYVGYIGSTATFTGEVTFNAVTAPTDVKVSFTCYNTTGVTLAPASFISANSAMSNAAYITLGSPRLGRLNNYVNGSEILLTNLSTVTYIPNTTLAGTSATDSFLFTAFNSSKQVVASGTVNVAVSLPAAPNNPNAITNINQFTDIPANAYYTASLTYLINKGVISGQGGGKFGPEAFLDYSQALKFIMNAAGYYETELSGANWALNYKNKAVQNGWLDSSVELTAPIPRVKMAELAAKVLGIPASTQASPFSDTTNPYAVALYYTTPQIIQGQTSGAKPVFNENQTLKRHEMVSLVYRMYQYSGK